MPKMLIVGGSGLVGSTLAQHASKSYDIHVTINENKMESSKIPFTRVNLLKDGTVLINLIKKTMPDVVINTVAHPSVDLCETDQRLADRLHVDATKEIAEACRIAGSKLVYFSTDAVFDGILTRKYSEDDKPNPINYYGKTKLIAEHIVTNESKDNVVLRTSVIYGWHRRSRFSNWIIQTLKEKKMVDPHMDQYNTPTLVDDLAKAILKIVELKISGLYHAVGKTCLSRYEFAQILAKKFELDASLIKPVTSHEKKQIAPRPAKSCLNAQKLEKKIGYDFCDIYTGVSLIFDKSKQSDKM